MKKITFLLLLLPLLAFGQDRKNRKKLTFEDKSEVLTRATGWAYNDTYGEWIDYENEINEFREDEKRYNYSKLFRYSSSPQKFTKIQTKTITYNTDKYYIIIIDRETGYNTHKLEAYVYNEEQYDKIRKINYRLTELKTDYLVDYSFSNKKYTENDLLDLIYVELSKKKDMKSYIYRFPIYKTKDGKIRFFLPSHEFGYQKRYPFDKCYFEVDEEIFSKIILD